MEKNSIEELIEKSNKKSKWRTVIVTVIPISLAFLFIFYFIKSNEEIAIQNQGKLSEKDSLLIEANKEEVIIGSDTKRDSLTAREIMRIEKKAVISDYFNIIEERDIDALPLILEDTLDRYYKFLNASIERIIKDQTYQWKHHPQQHFEHISLEFCDENQNLIWVTVDYTLKGHKYETLFIKFLVNSKMKIEFIRGFTVPKSCNEKELKSNSRHFKLDK